MALPVLSDSDILGLLKDGSLKIEGHNEKNLTPNGYDVTINEVLIPATGTKHKEGVVRIPGNSWFVIGTKEFFELPPDLLGQIWIRTTWVRKGILSSFGIIDAGFHGNLTFSAYNTSRDTVDIPIGERFAQVIFMRLASPSKKSYSERSGNYQGQRGITLEPGKRE